MDALNAVSLVAYAVATVLYLAYQARARPAVARSARIVLALGWVVQTVDIGIRCVHLQHPASSTPEAMAFIAWTVVAGYLLVSLRYRLEAAGSFVVPAAVILLLLARVVPASESAPSGSLMTAHIFLATLGVATFALASILEVLYLVQERRLKRKQLDRLRGAGTPLDTLDRLAARCVSIGFPIFTLALVLGAVVLARMGIVQRGVVRPEYLAAVASWLAFGVLLVARVGGWQGRRAAWLTVSGFAGVLLVVLGYFLRAAV